VVCLALLAGCHEDMWNQPKVRPFDQSSFFGNGSADRMPVPHTVDQAHFWTDEGRYTGYVGTRIVNGKLIPGRLVTRFPFKIGMADLQRGQQRYDIFCSPCHGVLGNGKGMIALRGLSLRRAPASYLTKRLRDMPIGHFYDVMTNGYGAMYSYASRITPDDRWRIAAYIRVLQRSGDAKSADIPANASDKSNLLQQMGGTATSTTPAPIGGSAAGTMTQENSTNG
jgi:mono/diheme cytochrome c family protein